MGFFSGLGAESYDRTYRDRELVKRMGEYFRPHLRALVGIFVAVLLIGLAGALRPVLISESVDQISHPEAPTRIVTIVVIMFILGVLVWLLNWYRRRLTTRAVGDVMLQLRVDAFQAAAEHDLSFYDDIPAGRIVSRITSDTQEFAKVVVLLTDLLNQFVEVVILFIVLIQIDLRLMLYLLVMLPFILLVSSGFRRLARKVTLRGLRAMGNVNAAIKESVTGVAVAKNFRQEATIHEEFNEINSQSYKINVQRGFVLSMIFPTLNAMGGIGTAILVYVGGLSAAEGIVTVGAWYLFISGLDRFWFPMLNLSAFWNQVQEGLSAAERVFGLIDAPPAVYQTNDLVIEQLEGRIRFEDVCFAYVENEQILEEFFLDISAGESVALVGHTGAGKSSLARLIARFYEFQSGRLLIDQYDVREFDLKRYRSRLGLVSQVPFLFSGTVAENIRYANARTSLDEIQTLARKIGDGEWLESLPHGLETEVGERGARLSMGQRQLVSLMRVLVQKPVIFVLDEATANIDPFTEAQIREALSLIMAQTTSILIAHRLSTVKASDRILVIDRGKILEEGTHHGLMLQNGHYSELYNTYFRHQSLDYIDQIRKVAAPSSTE
jgi:ATP-binding cassette, subfamily B, bacterial